jgi:hypothetical protein
MSTLLIVRNIAGEILRKCDALCYNGKGTHCDCCCGGRNHGVGLARARRNLKDFAHAAMIPYLPYEHERQEYLEVVQAPMQQMSLFTAEENVQRGR